MTPLSAGQGGQTRPMASLLLVRHGQSTWNATRRWQGWADPPLSELGEEQARDAVPRLRPLGLVAVFSSDLVRARQTAAILADGLGLPFDEAVGVEPGLRERSVGEWSGLVTEEIEERWPGMIEAWREGRVASPPGGEETDALTARVRAGLGRVAGAVGAAGPALVVCHGGVVRALERAAGEEALTLPNLGGRWFECTSSVLRAGPLLRLTDPDTPTEAPVF